MPNFEYIAKTADGRNVTGVMQAESEALVVRALDEKKLLPVSVREGAAGQGRRVRKVRARELGVMYGQLADLLKAGVPLLRALETVARASTKRQIAGRLRAVHEDVSAGKTFAEAVSAHPDVFSSLHAAMIRAGEEAGFLEDVLSNLSDFLERQDELQSKIRGAMIYPTLLASAGVVVIVLILVLLVPRFRPFFRGMDLPAPTLLLFGASDLLTNHLPLLLGLVVLAVIGVRALVRSESGKRSWERFKSRIPVVGKAARLLAITRFCRIFGTMLRNGVPILQALSISKDASGSRMLADVVEQARENVRAGQPVSEPLRASRLFPPEVIEMITVAEESNQLDKVLVEIADTVERRTNRQVDTAVRLLEPLILVLMAVMIGLAAVGLLYPIFTMSQAIAK